MQISNIRPTYIVQAPLSIINSHVLVTSTQTSNISLMNFSLIMTHTSTKYVFLIYPKPLINTSNINPRKELLNLLTKAFTNEETDNS